VSFKLRNIKTSKRPAAANAAATTAAKYRENQRARQPFETKELSFSLQSMTNFNDFIQIIYKCRF